MQISRLIQSLLNNAVFIHDINKYPFYMTVEQDTNIYLLLNKYILKMVNLVNIIIKFAFN